MRKLAHLGAAAIGAAALAVTLTAPVAANAGTSAPATAASTALHTAAHRPLAFTQQVILKNLYTGRCVDDGPRGLRAISCNRLNYQQWAMHFNGLDANSYTFKNKHTGRCIDDGPRGLRAISCNGLIYQQWFLNPILGYTLRNVHTRLCLDDSSQHGLRAYTCSGDNAHHNPHQDWSFG